MNRKDELKSAIEKAKAELRVIEEAENAEVNKTFVGKFFKYRNRYSSDESWWLYTTVIEISKDGEPLSFNFQKDCYGRIEFENDRFRPSLSAGYTEITEQEFWKAYDSIMFELNARRPTKRVPDAGKSALKKRSGK